MVQGDPGALVRWIVAGRRPATMPAGRYPTVMPQFGWMSAEDAAAIATYVRTHFGNAAPPVSAEDVRPALGDS